MKVKELINVIKLADYEHITVLFENREYPIGNEYLDYEVDKMFFYDDVYYIGVK